MSKKSYKEKLYERIFEGICEIDDIPFDDKGLYGMFGGLNIVELGIGQFADLNISIEEQERLGIDGDEFEKRFMEIDNKKKELVMQWRSVIIAYICDVKQFIKKSKEYYEWLEEVTQGFNSNIEWTIEMYKWAVKFLESLRRKLIYEVITNSLTNGEK